MTMPTQGQVDYLNPQGLTSNPSFTNVIVVTGPVKTVYIGGQDAVDAAGKIVGKDNIGLQTEQVLINLQTALRAAGAEMEHIVKWNIYMLQGQPLQPGFEVFRRMWGKRPNPPVITMMFVSGLANPDFLIEMDAVAVVPQ